MFLRAFLAFLILPGLAALFAPPLLAQIDPWRTGFFLPGGVILFLGLVLLLWCVRDFYASGKGTLAPWDPPQHLVTVGLYRFVRNPMYVGVLVLVAGWAMLLASPLVMLYDLFLAVAFHLRIVLYEEPWLAEKFGRTWQQYQSAVGRWRPRLIPWNERTR